jgi:hypothetical protein
VSAAEGACLSRLVVLAFSITTITGTAHADRDADRGSDASKVVMVGLLPLAPDGKGDLVGLRAAQGTRAIAEAALEELTHQQVVGHQALTDRLGKGYLPKWFECKSEVSCLLRLLAPFRDAGNRLALTGEYSLDGATYHVRMIAFFVLDGSVAKELRFDLAKGEINDQARWKEQLRPMLASRFGRIRIASNVGALTCTIDGGPCAFEPDGLTIAAPPGEHTIELSKADYLPERLTVTVETGTTQEVAIALKPLPENGRVVTTTGAPRRAPSLNAVRTDKVVEIDGKLDELAWQKAWIETNFVQNYPDEGKLPSERTELRVLYDEDAIYIGIRCYDSQPQKIVSRLTRRDRDIDADKVTVDISSKNDHSSSYTFQVNAANVQVDGTRFNDTEASSDWDGVWYSATSRDGKGWTAELAIPFAALRYSGESTSFGFQVRRYIERREEIDEWSYVPRDAKGEVSYYGSLEGLTGVRPGRLVQIIPYDSRNVTLRSQQGALSGSRIGDRAGADLKLGLSSGLALDATVNPDFGTVEVDQVVLNLSRFETFFPEKRPFFLEGADLFSTPFQLFYSRRIGRTPPETQVAGELVEPPPTGQILTAAKVTGLVGERFSIGALDAVTAREDATITRSPGAPAEKVLVDPLTNYGVIRLRQDFSKNSWLGLLATSVTRFEPPGLAAPTAGDLCPLPHLALVSVTAPVAGRCTNDAYTGGIDTVLRTSDGMWGASAQVVGSILQHGPSRLVPDGTLIRPGDAGWGIAGSLGKYGGEHWLYQLNVDYVNPKLEIDDAGFSTNASQIKPTSNDLFVQQTVTLRSTKPLLAFQSSMVLLNLRYRAFADTLKPGPSSDGAYLAWQGTFPNFWGLAFSGGPTIPLYNNRETRDGALLASPWGYVLGMSVTSDPRRSVTMELAIDNDKTTRGTATTATLLMGIHPLSFVEIDLILDASWSYGDPRWVYTQPNMDGSRTYFFQDLDSRSWDVLLRGTLSLSPTLSLQTYAQLYLDSGHYGRVTSSTGSGAHPLLDLDTFVATTLPGAINDDFIDSALNVNAFLRWQFRPGSALWLAYTRNQLNSPYDPMADGIGRLRYDKLAGPSTDVFLVKLSYMWEPFARPH